jgi:hypothetical protein
MPSTLAEMPATLGALPARLSDGGGDKTRVGESGITRNGCRERGPDTCALHFHRPFVVSRVDPTMIPQVSQPFRNIQAEDDRCHDEAAGEEEEPCISEEVGVVGTRKDQVFLGTGPLARPHSPREIEIPGLISGSGVAVESPVHDIDVTSGAIDGPGGGQSEDEKCRDCRETHGLVLPLAFAAPFDRCLT